MFEKAKKATNALTNSSSSQPGTNTVVTNITFASIHSTAPMTETKAIAGSLSGFTPVLDELLLFGSSGSLGSLVFEFPDTFHGNVLDILCCNNIFVAFNFLSDCELHRMTLERHTSPLNALDGRGVGLLPVQMFPSVNGNGSSLSALVHQNNGIPSASRT